MASNVRPFVLFHYGRKVGVIRAAKAGTVFNRAKREYPHIPSAELDLQDPSVIRKGDDAIAPKQEIEILGHIQSDYEKALEARGIAA